MLVIANILSTLLNMTEINRPRSAPSSNEIMREVKGKLRILLDAIKLNSGKFATAALSILTLSGSAMAESPQQIALNNSLMNSSPSASASADKRV